VRYDIYNITTLTTPMNLLETLKQLKSITADPSYTEKSRRMVLLSPQRESLTARRIFVRVFETAGSLALVGALVFAIVGGFSSSRYLSPVPFGGIDPAALRAEAQAIDMRINIADLNYTSDAESTSAMATSTHAGSSAQRPGVVSPGTAGRKSAFPPETSGGATSTASSTVFSINEALQQLEQ
jgi:hypothetical protein